jgi:hypothetical protein
MAAVTFDTPAGQEFLEHLNDVFFNRLVYSGGMDSLEMVHNDGKRWLVRYINVLVKQGRDKKAAPKQAITEEEEV